jgi:nucleoside-diphosphate-sugar epimerase
MTRILVTGALGQVGSELLDYLLASYDGEIIATDIQSNPKTLENPRIKYELLDVKNMEMIDEIVERNHIDIIFHLASILSATGEKDPYLAYQVNLTGTVNILNTSVRKRVSKVFIPSTIGVFGPETPKKDAPIINSSVPTTMYGITKASCEMLFQYYFNKYDLDVRSLRYPGLISYKVAPTAGTTDYAVDMLRSAAKGIDYKCYIGEDIKLPMMYMPDAMSATMQFMTTPKENIKIRTAYNIMSYSFSPRELESAIKEIKPEFKVTYEPDFREEIAKSWPESIDIKDAHNDWGFSPDYNLKKTVEHVLQEFKKMNP